MPTIDWEEWSAPAIRPYMSAIIYLPNETIHISDDEIVSVNFDEYMFDDGSVLFGPPSPGTGQIEIIDYAQRFNPMIEPALLTANIRIELYLGLWPINDEDNLGQNIVTSFNQPIEVEVDGRTTWATIIYTNNDFLHPLGRYKLIYTYSLADSAETYTEFFYVPGTWFVRNIYAITQDVPYHIHTVELHEVQAIQQPYGVFYAQDWTYNSVTHITSLEMIDGIALQLSRDSSAYTLMPSRNKNSLEFLVSMMPGIHVNNNVTATTLKYSTYQETYPKTVNSLIEALRASLITTPSGSIELFRFYWYDTGITLTDHDITEYILEQSSTAVYDSICVEYQKPTLKTEEVIFSEEDIGTENNNEFVYNQANVFDFSHFNCEDSTLISKARFVLKPVSCMWEKEESTALDNVITKGSVYGRIVKYTTASIFYGEGSHAYSIVLNNYIQTKAQAQSIVNTLSHYIFESYFTIKVTIRGCYGIWLGGLINVHSEMYNINNQYIITQISFDYSGGVRTTLTLQRRS